MALLCILIAVVTLLALYLLYCFTQLDCDVELVLAAKFGKPLSDFKDKVVWITGASSGIGEYLAYALAENGAKLAISGRNAERLEIVAEKCMKLGANDVICLPFDMTDVSVHEENFDKVLKKFGRFDILVNNAGRSQRAPFTEIDYEVDKALFEVNVFSLINLTRIVVRYFLEHNNKGQIAVTSSTAGLLGVPFSATYTASKHALHGYFESLRTEVGRLGIGITMLCPGPIFSNLLDNVFGAKIGEKLEMKHEANSRRMRTDRCAELMAIAIVNRLDQAWMTIQPILATHYLSQYWPWLARKIIPKFFTPERARKLREGK